jgi:hypothetical protein
MSESLEQLIRRNVSLGKPTNSGFHNLRCPICNDYKERLGIKFEGGNVGANCFNCGFKARYENGDKRISDRMRQLLKACQIDESELDRFEGKNFFDAKNNPKPPENISLDSLSKKKFGTPEQKLPDGSHRLLESPLDFALDAAEYLDNRKMLETNYPFHVSEKYPRRIIIPFYRNNKIIFWQARAIDSDTNPRYKGCSAPKEAIFFNYDALFRNYRMPLFVCEGVFDALCVDGVSTIGSTLNETKIEILKGCKRKLIFVLDPDKNGAALGEVVLNNGWMVTFAPNEDVNKSIQQYGRLYTIHELMKNAQSDSFQTRVNIALRCRGGKGR